MVKFVASFAITVTILIIFSTIFFIRDSTLVLEVSTFEECLSYGFPVIDSYPRQCHTPDGGVFYEKLKKDKSDLIVIDFSSFNKDSIDSPLTVRGKARGPWFFEADFPVFLYDAENNLVTTGIATAEEDWMTEEFVSFSTTLTFDKPSTPSGTLVFEKDNPSGLPEHNDSLKIPVKFAVIPTSDCRPTGCSGQLCAEEDLITTCEFLPQYACYKQAVCERQVSGSCGWTETAEFKECLASIP